MEKPEIVAALASLAHEHQLDVFRLLVQAGAGGLSASEIGDRLALPVPTLASTLVRLKQGGLVTSRNGAASIVYVANHDVTNKLLSYLVTNFQVVAGLLDGTEPAPKTADKRR